MNKIKYLSLGFVLSVSLVSTVSCNKKQTESPEQQASTNNNETSLEQEAKMLKNEKGESIKVVYFADGKEVAVKITKQGKEHHLKAKGTNNKGEPIFTDDTYAWEIMDSGTSGRLTEKSGDFHVYKPENEQ
jgi:hypothetical protein